MSRVRFAQLSLTLMILISLLTGCFANNHVITSGSPEELRANAMALYSEGDLDAATYQMALYLKDNRTDTDAMRTIIAWYTEMDKTAYAEKYIKLLGEGNDTIPEAELVLRGEIDSKLIVPHVSDAELCVSPLAVKSEEVVLTITGKNLYSGHYEKNEYLGAEADGWRSSEWFYVDENGRYLTISGGFNRAVWQFELLDGTCILSGDESKTYRVTNSNLVKNLATATTEIPQNAVRCRIAYAFEPDEESDTLDERVQIEYGMFPSDYETYRETTIEIPDMVEGSSVTWQDGMWWFLCDGERTALDLGEFELRKGDTITAAAQLPAVVTVNMEEAPLNTDGVYGVTWSNDDSSILLERTDDAEGLSFNYLSGEQFAGPYPNDFDHIYPWSEMRLCAIDAAGTTTYEDDPGFALDGSAGDVFVEIPKHYVRREVKDGVEYAAISATPREGFVLDPSFSRANGEVDKIYVAAYLTSIPSQQAASVSGTIPITNYSLTELEAEMDALSANRAGRYSEIDFFAVMTLQRLFMIEAGVRNSQVFWLGEVNKAYLSLGAPQQYALNDAASSNEIVIEDSGLNRRFKEGDAVCIATYEQFFGSRKYDNYYSRLVSDIEQTDGRLIIAFNGEPLNIIAGETQIAHISNENGKTDYLAYHSGSNGSRDGLTSFRYRHIENLWGNGFIPVSGVEVKDRTIQITYPNGRSSVLSYDLGLQQMSPGQTDEVDYGQMNIVSFGYDRENPLVMLPDAAGGSVSTSFGDTLYTGFTENWQEKTVGLLWGGTWDLWTSCGLFCYRIMSRDTDNFRENASRMMLWLP